MSESKMKYYCTLKGTNKQCWFSVNADDKDLILRKYAHEKWHAVYGFGDGGLRNNTMGKVEWILK